MTNAIAVSHHHCSAFRYSYLDERVFPTRMAYTPKAYSVLRRWVDDTQIIHNEAFDNTRFASMSRPTTPTTPAGPKAMFPASPRASLVVDDGLSTPRRESTTQFSDPGYVPEHRSRGVVPSTEKVPTNELPNDWQDVRTAMSTLVAEFRTHAPEVLPPLF
ncbi:hypothetical protein PENFLA_c029G10987 [Penicillium flavigenum]|uniref:Uncharacterized protein n=1 Tax=Penicillium flavigenum TaxID=254877 RepID=A0A1V6SR19_9EURO|nr:hypothetical protein PENFLA_c029G10987 [Penicillium flavigenum]